MRHSPGSEPRCCALLLVALQGALVALHALHAMVSLPAARDRTSIFQDQYQCCRRPIGAEQLRFLDNGPSIPNELLLARDQGRVVFFCGAGVSQAKARLPGFYELARRVVQILGVPSDSPAIALLDQAHIAEERTGLTGLIPADRIFGILERDFLVRDVEKAVATALQPPDAPDLSAHVTLLDLATAPEGEVRIVTTNFDRLFDDCDRDVQSWQRPYLPDPSRPGDINGVVYLHGKAAADYRSATGDGFVLSSSAFGRAYLADGWATSFFQQIIREYVVVFVGYAADDPPVQYLLEALNTRTDRPDRIYAFQSGEADEAASKWRHKGVAAIPYRDHPALWSTLDAWAVRARDPNAWYDSVVGRALRGPEELSPSERGQVAHVAATLEGLRKFFGQRAVSPSRLAMCIRPAHPLRRPRAVRHLAQPRSDYRSVRLLRHRLRYAATKSRCRNTSQTAQRTTKRMGCVCPQPL